MNLYEKIITIYPELINYDFVSGDIRLRDDGNGAYIKSWTHPTLSQPTQQQLDAITGDYIAPVVDATSISKRQLFLQLTTIGKWDALQTILNTPGNEFLLGLFSNSGTFYITDDHVVSMAAALGEDLQAFFNVAGAL